MISLEEKFVLVLRLQKVEQLLRMDGFDHFILQAVNEQHWDIFVQTLNVLLQVILIKII